MALVMAKNFCALLLILIFLSALHLVAEFKCESSMCSLMQGKWKESCNINTQEFLST